MILASKDAREHAEVPETHMKRTVAACDIVKTWKEPGLTIILPPGSRPILGRAAERHTDDDYLILCTRAPRDRSRKRTFCGPFERLGGQKRDNKVTVEEDYDLQKVQETTQWTK